MVKVVTNTSPLIYLAKIDELELLSDIFDDVYVPMPVYKETQEKRESDDAIKIKNSEFLIREPLKDDEKELTDRISKEYGLGKGESSVIALYKSRKLNYALLANTEATHKAKNLGIRVMDPLDIGKIVYDSASLKSYLLKLINFAGYTTQEIEEELEKLKHIL
ncbi:MAG: hypothetical protein KJ767_00900 [Nanoarchaeota archaeon]|nr:hypothetical protein [Nanoarchaeota archaeon]